jgi:hypothetical protein
MMEHKLPTDLFFFVCELIRDIILCHLFAETVSSNIDREHFHIPPIRKTCQRVIYKLSQ